ncbi:3-ketoacyl-CoA synthase 12 [Senna tora]|uniref:3-ketoacyl-CoA synthase 12 n=1 Tax=Senna tora TaxID=362788 RepID=A0A834WVL1_9FABA|nr:3-ketoacyl-CoA synthase 12 [Senna tora]
MLCQNARRIWVRASSSSSSRPSLVPALASKPTPHATLSPAAKPPSFSPTTSPRWNSSSSTPSPSSSPGQQSTPPKSTSSSSTSPCLSLSLYLRKSLTINNACEDRGRQEARSYGEAETWQVRCPLKNPKPLKIGVDHFCLHKEGRQPVIDGIRMSLNLSMILSQ